MNITVGDLKVYLDEYDEKLPVKFAVGKFNNMLIVHDYGYMMVNPPCCDEHGEPELIIYPYQYEDMTRK